MGPSALAADGELWVGNFRTDTVARINSTTRELVGDPIRVGRDPLALAVSNGVVWVSNGSDGTVSGSMRGRASRLGSRS